MSAVAIQALIGIALIDQEFCERLLNGERAKLLEEFSLSNEEQRIALAIEATSIQEFAVKLHQWLTA